LCQISACRTVSEKRRKALEGQGESNPNPRIRKKGEKELAVTPESSQWLLGAPGQWLGGHMVMQQQMFREKSKGEEE